MGKNSIKLKIVEDSVHTPFFSEDVRNGDPIFATIKINDMDNKKVRVWKVSPLGVELKYEFQRDLSPEDNIKITLHFGKQKSLPLESLFLTSKHENGNNISCFRFISSNKKKFSGNDRRLKKRWNCSSDFYPTGIASSPAKFNDFIYFKVQDISLTGMQLTCSMRNKLLAPGITLNAIINFPMISQLSLNLKIVTVTVINNENMGNLVRLGVEYNHKKKQNLVIISDYLAQFGNIDTIKNLKHEGFKPDKISQRVKFKVVKSKVDFNETLELRHLSYSHSSIVDKSIKIEEMTDEFDAKSRIINGLINEKVVCSARVTFTEANEQTEIEKYCSDKAKLPNSQQSIEMSRLCTHPEYRGGDLLMGMLHQVALICVKSNKRYAVLVAQEKMLPLFKKLGFKKTGAMYLNKKFPKRKAYVVSADLHKVSLSSGVNPIIWNLIWADMTDYLIEQDIIHYTTTERLRLKILKLFKPLALLIVKFKRYK